MGKSSGPKTLGWAPSGQVRKRKREKEVVKEMERPLGLGYSLLAPPLPAYDPSSMPPTPPPHPPPPSTPHLLWPRPVPPHTHPARSRTSPRPSIQPDIQPSRCLGPGPAYSATQATSLYQVLRQPPPWPPTMNEGAHCLLREVPSAFPGEARVAASHAAEASRVPAGGDLHGLRRLA